LLAQINVLSNVLYVSSFFIFSVSSSITGS